MQEDIQKRIIKVERSNKILKILLFLSLIISLSASGYGLFISYRNYSKLKEDLSEAIITKEIIVRNNEKNRGIILTSNSDSASIYILGKKREKISMSISDEPSIEIVNKSKNRINLEVNDTQSEILLYHDDNNIYIGSNKDVGSISLGSYQKQKLSLFSGSNISPNILFSDNNLKERIILGLDMDNGAPSFNLFDNKGNLKTTLGSTTLEHRNTKKIENISEANLIFFNESGNVTRRYK